MRIFSNSLEYLSFNVVFMNSFTLLTSKDFTNKLFAKAVGEAGAAVPDSLGLLVCGSGIGISISANKINGIRAALVSDPYAASLSRLHNNANVICLGARLTGPDMAWECVKAFLDTAFAGGRHEKRVAKIAELEKL